MSAPIVYLIGPCVGQPVDFTTVPERMIHGDIIGGYNLGSLWERVLESGEDK